MGAVERPARGFTLIELVLVLVILGVLAIAVLPRFFDRRMFEARGFHDATTGLLRHAHQSAIAQRRTVCVAFGPAAASLSVASLPDSNTCDRALAGPAGEMPFAIQAPAGIAYAATPADFRFDARGRASMGQTIQVQGVNEAMVIEAATGLVHR